MNSFLRTILLVPILGLLPLSPISGQDTPPGCTDVKVAAADSPEKEKAAADFVCNGENDQETIQKAIDAVGTGGTVLLASGNYFIDAFHEASSGPDYALKTCRLNTFSKIVIKGSVRATGWTVDYSSTDRASAALGVIGTNLVVSRECYESLKEDKEYAVIRGDDKGNDYWNIMSQELTVRDLSITLPDNRKNIICIDGFHLGALNVDDVRLGTLHFNRSMDPEQEFHVGVPGCIGIRGVQGSNNGSETIFSSTYAIGLGTGFALSGEHLVCIQLGAIGNIYGYTFNAFAPQVGVWCHPITLINCCDEVSANYPYFGPNPYGQNVNLINFNMEHYTSMFSKGGDYAREAVPGQWGGNIDYDIQDWEADTWNKPFPGNSQLRRFWAADGSGMKMTSRNNAQKHFYTSEERRRIAPNVGQVIFDETLGRPLICREAGDYASALLTVSGKPSSEGTVSIRVGNTLRNIPVPSGMKDAGEALEYLYKHLMVGTSCKEVPGENSLVIFNNMAGAITPDKISADAGKTGLKVKISLLEKGKDNIWVDMNGERAE